MPKGDRVLDVMLELAERARAKRLAAYKPQPQPEEPRAEEQQQPQPEEEEDLGSALEAFTTE